MSPLKRVVFPQFGFPTRAIDLGQFSSTYVEVVTVWGSTLQRLNLYVRRFRFSEREHRAEEVDIDGRSEEASLRYRHLRPSNHSHRHELVQEVGGAPLDSRYNCALTDSD